MSERIFARLFQDKSNNSLIHWTKVKEDGHSTDVHISNSPTDFKEKLNYEKIEGLWWILDDSEITIHKLTITQNLKGRLEQVIPALLEEQLAEPIENLHFVPLALLSPQEVNVAVMSKEWLSQKLMTLKPWFEHPSGALFGPWLLGLESNSMTWVDIDERTSWFNLSCNDIYSVPSLIKDTFIKTLPEPSLKHLDYLSTKPISSEIDKWCKKNDLSTEECLLSNSTDVLTTLFKTLPLDSKAIKNGQLLRGVFAPKTIPKHSKKSIKLAFALCALSLALVYGKPLIEGLWFQQSESLIDNQILKLGQTIEPKLSHSSQVQGFLRQQISNLSNQADPTIFLSLQAIDVAIEQTPISITRFDYRQNKVAVNFEIKDFLSLERFVTTLKEQGLVVTQDQATSRNNKVQALLTLEILESSP